MAATLGLLGSCASIGGTPPPFVLKTQLGSVRAYDETTTRETAQAFLRFANTLPELAPGMRSPRLDVWVQDRLDGSLTRHAAGGMTGATLSRKNRGAFRIEIARENLEDTLAHELVHAMLGPSWRTLPPAVEEGLCDSLSLDLVNRGEKRLSLLASAAQIDVLDGSLFYRASREGGEWKQMLWKLKLELNLETQFPHASNLEPSEVLTLSDIHARSSADEARAYSVGFVLVQLIRERVGISGLHELCRRADGEGLRRVPAAWVLAAAGIRDNADLRQRVEQMIANEPAIVLDWIDPEGRRIVIQGLREHSGYATDDAADFFRKVNPRLQLFDGPPSALNDSPGLVDWARERWSELSPLTPTSG